MSETPYNDVNEKIRRSLWHFPTLFDCASKALEHMLCTGGGGYEWNSEGELEHDDNWDDYPRPDNIEMLMAREYKKHYEDEWRRIKYSREDDSKTLRHPHEIMIRIWRELGEKEIAEINKIRPNAARISVRREPFDKKKVNVYPMSDANGYCNLVNWPDHISPDWAAAVRWVASEIVRIGGGCRSYGDAFPGADEKANAENVRIAQKALDRLEMLDGAKDSRAI
jgi:hypothetical protein